MMDYEQISALAAQGDAVRQMECYGQRKQAVSVVRLLVAAFGCRT